MKRSTFFKSLAVLFGIAVTKPLELFGEKKDDKLKLLRTTIGNNQEGWTEYNYEGIIPTIKYKKVGVIDGNGKIHPIEEMEKLQLKYYEDWMKLQQHILKSKPSGYMWDWDKINEAIFQSKAQGISIEQALKNQIAL